MKTASERSTATSAEGREGAARNVQLPLPTLYFGVYRSAIRHKRYEARIEDGGQTIVLGTFKDARLAARIVDDELERRFGFHARKNFPVFVGGVGFQGVVQLEIPFAPPPPRELKRERVERRPPPGWWLAYLRILLLIPNALLFAGCGLKTSAAAPVIELGVLMVVWAFAALGYLVAFEAVDRRRWTARAGWFVLAVVFGVSLAGFTIAVRRLFHVHREAPR